MDKQKEILDDFIKNHNLTKMTLREIIADAYMFGYLRGYNNLDEEYDWFQDLTESEKKQPDYWNY